MLEQHYSVNSAAELLDVSSKTIRREIKRKDLRIFRVSGMIRIPESELIKILSRTLPLGDVADEILSRHSGEKYGKN